MIRLRNGADVSAAHVTAVMTLLRTMPGGDEGRRNARNAVQDREPLSERGEAHLGARFTREMKDIIMSAVEPSGRLRDPRK